MPNLDRFTLAYIEAALWSSTDDNGQPLDSNYSIENIDAGSLAKMVAECKAFQEECAGAIQACDGEVRSGDCTIEEQAGHDFWLTRCNHGAGFWDGDWPEPHATVLDEAAKRFGNVDLMVGTDADEAVIYSL